MDRLICGDVGFGKTEVAMRAAFKVASEGRQVVVLCPTTVLCAQHFQTFSERMAPFPLRVDQISRFRSTKEQNKTLSDVRDGAVDILIGTHRILSKDVQFKDLGLVIVDEEQRFGVTHKERLKQLRKTVDVLSMSATRPKAEPLSKPSSKSTMTRLSARRFCVRLTGAGRSFLSITASKVSLMSPTICAGLFPLRPFASDMGRCTRTN
jgi:superfamily II helicase